MSDSPIVYAHVLNGPNPGPCDEQTLIKTLRDETLGWVHLDGTHPKASEWISKHLDYLDPQAIEALLDVDTRPRMMPMGVGMIAILRGINFNEGESPEDMVSVRMYIDAYRIVTISRRRVRAIERMDTAERRGSAPTEAGMFLVRLVEDLVGKIGNFAKDLDLRADELEDGVYAHGDERMRRAVLDLRLQVVAMLRFLIPQREVLMELAHDDAPFIDDIVRRELEEEVMKMIRIVEDMTEVRDQMMILREELSGQLSDRLNKNMFIMSIASVIFLPLGFLTGLFGVNVAGMPGVDDGRAFYILSAVCAGIVVLLLLVIWQVGWIGRRRR
ncbi:zinc transporter ZntB [Pseudoprimorskyibacter insulae]|uniref:Zinc transport protein ZntB n=1 Tax=Pseudoprimorskyibacter insulae TaxID=1695997 RepID=A0A2R8ANX5_9RHOB|nr:zinc transporter ZntB [Pseudoprimorskyibacter insulae]SPF77733.1 Zinc transport protein ZntB [Pseudoprimorskyibacter insulae]